MENKGCRTKERRKRKRRQVVERDKRKKKGNPDTLAPKRIKCLRETKQLQNFTQWHLKKYYRRPKKKTKDKKN